MIYAFCIACPVWGESTAHWQIPLQAINSANFAVWLMLFALPMERWCLIKSFRSAVPVCNVSCGSSSQKRCLLSCMSKRAVEQTVEMQLSRKHMKNRLCHCYVICHSVIDDITGPVCGETTGHQMIPVARGDWSEASGGPVCGDYLADRFP